MEGNSGLVLQDCSGSHTSESPPHPGHCKKLRERSRLSLALMTLHPPCLQQRDADAGSWEWKHTPRLAGSEGVGLDHWQHLPPELALDYLLLWVTTHLTIALDNHMVKVNGPVLVPIMSHKRWKRSNKVKSCSYVWGGPIKKV